MTRNIGEFIKEAVTKYSDKPSLKIEEDGKVLSLSFREVYSKSCQFASFLKRRGIDKGDRVAIWGGNCPEWVICYFGCLVYGAVTVPIDLRTTKETIAHFFKTAMPVLGISIRDGEHFKELVPDEIFLEEVFDLIDGFLPEADFKVDSSDLAEIVYTSGTTGEPKGAALTHGALISGIRALFSTYPVRENYRVLSIFPLSHVFEELIGLLIPFHKGASVFYLNRITVQSIMGAFMSERVTCMLVVPEFLRFMEKAVERKAGGLLKLMIFLMGVCRRLPFRMRRLVFFPIHRQMGGSLEFFCCSGAPLERRVRDFFEGLGIRVFEGYGSTEMIGVSLDLYHEKPLSVGKILPGVKVKISKEGEILVKSRSLFNGYFGDPERTESVFVEGWYKSGDVGRIDRDGYLFLSGRDFFKIVLPSAMKVYVEDVERELNEHPLVLESCVVGVKRSDGNRVCAVLILKGDPSTSFGMTHSTSLGQALRCQIASSSRQGETLRNDSGRMVKQKQVIQEINYKLEEHQQIMEYHVWDKDDFPRTPLMKIDRKKVLEWAQKKNL